MNTYTSLLLLLAIAMIAALLLWKPKTHTTLSFPSRSDADAANVCKQGSGCFVAGMDDAEVAP